ncbi:MAG TPA: DMT family transporter [Rhodocyclaceae bacterium]|nr:DMT family transporter [Rhodocyclaceae bacterium]
MQFLWMLLASLLFACMGVCVKFAAAHYAAAEIVFYRAFISLLLMLVLVRLRGVALSTPHWRLHLGRGVTGFLALFSYFVAISLLPLATAVTLNYTSAIFLALYLACRGWRIGRGMMLALGVGLLGVILLLQPTLQADQWLGGMVGLGSGVLAAAAYFHVRELGALGEPETRTVFYFALVSSVCAGGWLLFQQWHPLDARGALLLFGVAIFATAAQLAMTRAYKRTHTLVAAALAYSTVVFASLFGVLFWAEHLDLSAWCAILLIMASGVAATHFSKAVPAEGE